MACESSRSGIRAYQQKRDDWNRKTVRGAIERLRARGTEVSFYNVAEESAISRSTLYRNAALRAMVEDARAAGPVPVGFEELLGQMAELRSEVDALKRMWSPARGFIYADVAIGAFAREDPGPRADEMTLSGL